MNTDDTAATLQQTYDEAVATYGAESLQAWAAKQEALRYFNRETEPS